MKNKLFFISIISATIALTNTLQASPHCLHSIRIGKQGDKSGCSNGYHYCNLHGGGTHQMAIIDE